MTIFKLGPELSPSPYDHERPRLPSAALVSVVRGRHFVLTWQGSDLDYLYDVDGERGVREALAPPDGVADGVYAHRVRVWSSGPDWNGEYDEGVDTVEWRPATDEELDAFAADDVVFDLEAYRARQTFDEAQRALSGAADEYARVEAERDGAMRGAEWLRSMLALREATLDEVEAILDPSCRS